MSNPLLVLVGATASGKSAVAVPLAEQLGAEILSLDSMLVYRGMEIGTDKPPAAERARVPHHLIDLLDPSQPFDLRRYLRAADAAVAEVQGRGRRVLIVGGTGLYLMGLCKGVFESPPVDPELRARLEALPTAELRARVEEIDPELWERVHPNDHRRLRRAAEVYEQTGTPLSELQRQFQGPDRYPAVFGGIRRSRPDLHARIRTRVDAMFAGGLVDEVRGLELGPTAAQAVGYKEVRAALDGEHDLDQARALVVRHTVRLVRRQSAWFKRFPIRWVDAAPGEGPEQIVPRLLEIYPGKTAQ